MSKFVNSCQDNMRNQQQHEIDTIKERHISVKLSDADVERVTRLCGRHGLTVGELLENFIGDLVGGTYSNGSDERDRASSWFERCWFGMFPENTLLHHLLEYGYDPEEYVEYLENIEEAEGDKRHYEEHPEEYDDEEMSWIDDDIADWRQELKYMTEDWKPEKKPNMDEELETLKKWISEREAYLNED